MYKSLTHSLLMSLVATSLPAAANVLEFRFTGNLTAASGQFGPLGSVANGEITGFFRVSTDFILKPQQAVNPTQNEYYPFWNQSLNDIWELSITIAGESFSSKGNVRNPIEDHHSFTIRDGVDAQEGFFDAIRYDIKPFAPADSWASIYIGGDNFVYPNSVQPMLTGALTVNQLTGLNFGEATGVRDGQYQTFDAQAYETGFARWNIQSLHVVVVPELPTAVSLAAGLLLLSQGAGRLRAALPKPRFRV